MTGGRDGDFVLDKPEHKGASVLVTGANFGCGSSREHAPWALRDFGSRRSSRRASRDIFRANCYKTGLLAVTLPGPAGAPPDRPGHRGSDRARSRSTSRSRRCAATASPTASRSTRSRASACCTAWTRSRWSSATHRTSRTFESHRAGVAARGQVAPGRLGFRPRQAVARAMSRRQLRGNLLRRKSR